MDEVEHAVNEDNFYAKIKAVIKDTEKYKRTVSKVVNKVKEYGGKKMEYKPEAESTKFLIGAKQRTIFHSNKKKNDNTDPDANGETPRRCHGNAKMPYVY